MNPYAQRVFPDSLGGPQTKKDEQTGNEILVTEDEIMASFHHINNQQK